MTSLFGAIENHNPNNNENIHEYVERLEFYFSANRIIEDNKKRSVLLTVIGKETYHLIRNLAAPTDLPFKPSSRNSEIVD